MSQILHIFRKDTRRFWPEITVSLVVVAGMVWTSPHTWRALLLSGRANPAAEVVLTRAAEFMPLLVIVGWWLLITRVIHAENLVGNTQFWITRPYEWKKLLAAKVLFLGVYLYLPLALAQDAMLALAGFHPAWHVAGLLYDLLLITTALILPFVALACVTSTLARMVLTMLGLFVCIVGFILSASFGILGTVNGPNLPISNLISWALTFCLCCAAIGLQYATRRVGLARVVLLAVPVCVFAFAEFAPFHTVEQVYARQSSGGDAVPALIYRPTPGQVSEAVTPNDKQIRFGVPVEAVGLPDKTILAIDDVKIAMEAPDGTRWVSPWQGTFDVLTKRGTVNLVLPRSIYTSFLGKPLSLHLTLAISQAQEESATSIPLRSVEVTVPGDGICSARSSTSERAGEVVEQVTARCRFPLRLPFRRMSLLMPGPGCNSAGEEWTGSLASEPAEFAIDPVWADSGLNTGYTSTFNGDRPANVCTATGVARTQYRLERRIEVSMTIPDYQLPQFPPSRR